ncbi:thaumatin-like protein 1 [Nymphaea colorata]|nr:thaumatin-like protein 1 [Nymphaea colorata]
MEAHLFLPLFFLIVGICRGAQGVTFTFANNCGYTVWPGILSNAGSPSMSPTGFELASGTSRSLQAPTGWAGRFWGRTGCAFDGSGQGGCRTGDCANRMECDGAGAKGAATLAEFSLGGFGGKDYYDVSLVDGYNLPLVVTVSGGSSAAAGPGWCATTGCAADLNQRCPAELRVEDDGGEEAACRSACDAFQRPEFCCAGDYANPNTCKPSYYAAIFKEACPRAYSYAFDDATSTFTCANADYTITFCPNFTSQKASRDSSTPRTATGVVLSEEGWLATLATADASSSRVVSFGCSVSIVIASIIAMNANMLRL